MSRTAALVVSLTIAQSSGMSFASEASAPYAAPAPTIEVVPPAETTEIPVASVSPGARVTLGTTSLAMAALLEPDASAATRGFRLPPATFSASAGQIYQGAPYPYPHRHDASIAALMIGAAAAITGAAVLVYANRPECSYSPYAGGCGYGTKVVGTAVLSGGIVGLFVGALTW